MSRRTTAWAVAVFLGVTLLIHVAYLARCGDGLSLTGDPYSEANALRAGERFAVEGFTVNRGLPDVTYGRRYPGVGISGSSGTAENDTVYHGYPPGSDWLAGVSIRLFGVAHVGRFRLVPVALGMIAAAVFLGALMRTIGGGRGLFVYLCCLLAPAFTNMTHGLYYHGYALSLLLLEASVLMAAFRRPGRLGAGPPAWLGLLGFLQGWLSFDYCFVVTFAAAPLALLATPAGEPLAWRKVLRLVVAAGLGFTLAHGLHFLQSVLYFGSVHGAVEEYAFRSAKVYGGAVLEGMSRPEKYLHGLRMYLTAYLRWTSLFSPASFVLGGATVAVFALTRGSVTVGRRFRLDAVLSPRPRDAGALGLALAIGLCWLAAKPYHALNHLIFSGRHLFLFYFASSVVVARAVRLEVERCPDEEFRALSTESAGVGDAPLATAAHDLKAIPT